MDNLYQTLKDARDIADYENKHRICETIEILLEVINNRERSKRKEDGSDST